MHRNEEFLKKIFNLLFYLSEQDPEKLKLPRYPEAILDRTAHLLSGQCWSGWSWDHGLLLSRWICNPTTLLWAYSMKIKALHHWASQGFTNWAEFTETNIWKPSSSNATTRKHKWCYQEPSSNQRACLSKKKLVGLYGTLPVDAADVKNVRVFNPGDWTSIWRTDPLKISKIHIKHILPRQFKSKNSIQGSIIFAYSVLNIL